MKLTTPFSILRDTFKSKPPKSTTCYIDDTQVCMKDCDVEHEDPNLDFWDEACGAYPTNSHWKAFDT